MSASCGVCGARIARLDIGWAHDDPDQGVYGWLCPEPHMTLASPVAPDPLTDPIPAGAGSRRRPTPIPGTARRSHPPHPGAAIA
ncbi:MAG: hypothetical protein ACRDT8_15865 [Micromonosporaceae bacterium]